MGFAKLRLQSYGSLVFGVTSQSPFPLSAISQKIPHQIEFQRIALTGVKSKLNLIIPFRP